MRGAIPPHPNTPSWRGTQLKKKHRDNFTFTSSNNDPQTSKKHSRINY